MDLSKINEHPLSPRRHKTHGRTDTHVACSAYRRGYILNESSTPPEILQYLFHHSGSFQNFYLVASISK